MTAHRQAGRGGAAWCAAVLAGLTLAACGGADGSEPAPRGASEPAPEPESGTAVEGDGWRGTLLESHHASMTLPDGTLVDATSHVPQRTDAARFEAALPPTEEFAYGVDGPETIELDPGYVRQYTELRGDGHRQLVVQGLCEEFTEEPDEPELSAPDWTTEWIAVADGGSCFWNASMDLASGEILAFSFNGVG